MILHFYFARKFAWTFLGITAVFLTLMTLIDLVEQLRRFSSKTVAFGDVIELTLFNAPQGIYNILPLVMILATVTMFLGLARSSELVVTRASGRSALHSLVAPIIVATVIGVLTITLFNPIVAATSKRYQNLYDAYKNGGADTLSISSEGLWLRQGGVDGQTVIHATSANSDATILYGVTFISYAPDGGPQRRIESASAQLEIGAWKLTNAKLWPLNDEQNANQNPEAKASFHETMSIQSTLTIDRIRNSFGTPSAISIWDLPAFIAQLEQAGFSARRYSVWFQMELARPLFLVAMVLISSAFTMRSTRAGGTGIAVLSAIMLGFTLYYIRNFAQILGENGQIPVLLAAWAPPVASVLLALGILLHKEDG